VQNTPKQLISGPHCYGRHKAAQAMADAAMERVDKDKERREQANSTTTR
jgi:hypothetical protein